MERNEIYKFVKTIIENGIENDLKESKIADGVDKYLNLLNDQNLIDSEYYGIMQIFKMNIKLIVEKKIDVDQVYSICLNTIESVKPLSKKTKDNFGSLVSPNKDKPLTISNIQGLINEDESYNKSSSSSCGSPIKSSSSSCGSSINDSVFSSSSSCGLSNSEKNKSYVYGGCSSSRSSGSC